MTINICGQCKFWVASRPDSANPQMTMAGTCKRYPPRDDARMTLPDDWCGEFEPGGVRL